MLDGLTVLYKSNVDLYFYVLGGPQVIIVLSILFTSRIVSPNSKIFDSFNFLSSRKMSSS